MLASCYNYYSGAVVLSRRGCLVFTAPLQMSGHFCPVNSYSPTEKNDNRRHRSNTALGWLFSLTCVGHNETWPKPETDQNYESSKLVSGMQGRFAQSLTVYVNL